MNVPSLENFWTLWLWELAIHRSPSWSITIPEGPSSWPSPLPASPHHPTVSPSVFNINTECACSSVEYKTPFSSISHIAGEGNFSLPLLSGTPSITGNIKSPYSSSIVTGTYLFRGYPLKLSHLFKTYIQPFLPRDTSKGP